MKTRVAILGASGYTGLELLRLLLRHPHVEITLLSTSRDESPPIGAVHPQLLGRIDLKLESATPQRVAEQADCVFGCLPHAASAQVMSELLAHNLKVIDLSADYRLVDAAVYEKWYGLPHPDAGRLG